ALTDDLLGRVEADLSAVDLGYLQKEIPRAIRQSLGGVDRVSKIVLAMKEFSHPGTNEKSQVNLNHAIESTLTVCHNEWKYVAEVVTHLDADLPLVLCRPGETNKTDVNMLVKPKHENNKLVADGTSGKG